MLGSLANPVGQIWSGSMILDHLGRQDLGEAVLTAVEDVLEEGRVRTPDLGGRSTTDEMVDAILARLEERFRQA